eukprot:CAMPEP_0119310060 /NCGR_PEP_ID=MMETSP1333-20130426/17679_1 /TAXON_ID=418940 /ORGANISM="Scyphosphaera apsteinii, Strain RCC1455" /LENGTH=249 /DNA_ID=CAMNT_0007314177 /DNA_START=315 /DNA_END=1065 /DNA_ORIENTATION=-
MAMYVDATVLDRTAQGTQKVLCRSVRAKSDAVAALDRTANRFGNRVHAHHQAFGTFDGTVVLGLDHVTSNAEGSSLALSKRTKSSTYGVIAGGGRVGNNSIQVQMVDGVAFLRKIGKRDLPLALKIDVEAYEFVLIKELLRTGVLCELVDELFVEWHPGRASWREEGLPIHDNELHKALLWMLHYNSTEQTRLVRGWVDENEIERWPPKTKHSFWGLELGMEVGFLVPKNTSRPAWPSAHCRTRLFRWG